MKVVSDALYEAIHKRNRKFKLRVDFGEFQITNAENYKTELISSPSSGLAVGCVAIGSGSFEIKNNVVDVANKVFRAYIGMEIQGQMEWVKLGKYTVKNIEKKGTKDVVSFENDISLLDERFDETLTLPTTSTAVLERIETICGVKFDFNSFNVYTVIDKQLEGYSCRDIVGWIAQLMGLFVVVDNQTEQISAKWYVDSGYVINDTNYLYMIDEPTTDAHFRLEAISCQTGLETLVASNENAVGVMSISNPLMTQSRLDAIFSERKNFEYDEGELSFLLGNPLFDPWDIITVEYRGKTSVFPVMSLSFAFNGGFTTKVKTFVRDEDTAFEGNITKQIADIKTKVTVLDGYVATEVVEKGKVITAINASKEGVKIKGEHIDLEGQVTFSSLDNEVKTSIDTASTNATKANANTDIVSSANGTQLSISDSAEANLLGYTLYGKSVKDETAQTITSVGDSGSVETQITGANLWSGEISYKTAPTSYSFNNGIVKLLRSGGAIQGGFWSIEKFKSGIYTISFNADGVGGINLSFSKSANPSASTVGTYLNTWYANGVTTYTFELTEDSYLGFFTDGDGQEITLSNIMLNEDATALPYTPYQSQTYHHTLTEPLRGIGDVRDEIDFVRGVRVTRFGEVDMGTLDWYINYDEFVYTMVSENRIKANGLRNFLVENGIVADTYTGAWDNNFPEGTWGGSALNGLITYRMLKGEYADTTTFKSAMQGVKLVYELATPIETPLTDEEMVKFRNMHTYESVTIISTDSIGDIKTEYVRNTDLANKLLRAVYFADNATLAEWCYKNNKTLINGGVIATGTVKTKQLDVEDIFAQNIDMSGTFTAVSQAYVPPDIKTLERIKRHLLDIETIPNAELSLYDFDGNGKIGPTDFVRCQTVMQGQATLQEAHINAQTSTVTVTITPSNPYETIKIAGTDMWGQDFETVVATHHVIAKNIQEQFNALKGVVLYEADQNVVTGIYPNGKIAPDSVNSASFADPIHKYKRLKLYARFPKGLACIDFPLDYVLNTDTNYGTRTGGIFLPSADNTNGANNHWLYKLNFAVHETISGWTFQVTDAGWMHSGIPAASKTQWADTTVTINGTAYAAWNQRHNSDYAVYKIVGYEI